MRETWVRSLGGEDPLEKKMEIHSSTIAWKIPWTEEPGRLQFMGFTMRETWVQSLGGEDPLEKKMEIHSSTTAWKIPWTEEPGRLQFMGLLELDTTERLHYSLTVRLNTKYIYINVAMHHFTYDSQMVTRIITRIEVLS